MTTNEFDLVFDRILKDTTMTGTVLRTADNVNRNEGLISLREVQSGRRFRININVSEISKND